MILFLVIQLLLDYLIDVAFLNTTPQIMQTAAFLFQTLIFGKHLDAGTAFSAMILMDTLKTTLIQIPVFLIKIGQAHVSLGRIDKFLNSAEVDRSHLMTPEQKAANAAFAVSIRDGIFLWGSDGEREEKAEKSADEKKDTGSIQNGHTNGDGNGHGNGYHKLAGEEEKSVEEGKAGEEAGEEPPEVLPTLTDINFDVPPGSLVCVYGICGGGKSSLLAAILGEIRKREGTVEVTGSIAFTPQKAWSQNATVVSDVIFFAFSARTWC